MKNTALLWLSFLLLSVLVIHAPDIALAQPKIKFDEMIHHFGDVMQGEVVEHTFIFHNEGDEELVIEKVSPS